MGNCDVAWLGDVWRGGDVVGTVMWCGEVMSVMWWIDVWWGRMSYGLWWNCDVMRWWVWLWWNCGCCGWCGWCGCGCGCGEVRWGQGGLCGRGRGIDLVYVKPAKTLATPPHMVAGGSEGVVIFSYSVVECQYIRKLTAMTWTMCGRREERWRIQKQPHPPHMCLWRGAGLLWFRLICRRVSVS